MRLTIRELINPRLSHLTTLPIGAPACRQARPLTAGRPTTLDSAAGIPAPAPRQQRPHLRQPTGSAVAAGPPAAAAAAISEPVDPQWNDVVEYLLPKPLAGATRGLGRVEEVANGLVTLAPLEEDENDVWVESHDTWPTVLPQTAVLRVLDCDYSQRQDREGNPHGEHAHDVYTLLAPPSADVYRGPRTLKVVLCGGSEGGSV